MSTLPNATNLAPGTTYFASGGGGGGGGIASGVLTRPLTNPTNAILSDTIASSENPYNGNNIIGIFNSVDGTLGPLQVGGDLEVQEGGNSASSVLCRTFYSAAGVVFAAKASGSSFPYVSVNQTSNAGELFSGVALANISSINGGALLNVSSINGSVYPPPTPAPSGLSTFTYNGGGNGTATLDPNAATEVANQTFTGLPVSQAFLFQGDIGINTFTGSNVTGYIQFGFRWENGGTTIFSDPTYYNTDLPFVSSIRICGVVTNPVTNNQLTLLGSNTSGAGVLCTARIGDFSMTQL